MASELCNEAAAAAATAAADEAVVVVAVEAELDNEPEELEELDDCEAACAGERKVASDSRFRRSGCLRRS